MRKIIKGTPNRPRLYIFRSNKHIYAQIIDDTKQKILFSSSSLCHNLQNKVRYNNNCQTAYLVGKDIANKSKLYGINQIIFDRGNKLYHGRIKTLANAAREEGLIF
uniref:Large ribosomal subunit protein uL18c n=1 Tax=Pterocladia lucida TaxID=31408 RepID=A0A6M3WW88_PTELU|nr:ribosomal protein L18 [Pterocladia lucida]